MLLYFANTIFIFLFIYSLEINLLPPSSLPLSLLFHCALQPGFWGRLHYIPHIFAFSIYRFSIFSFFFWFVLPASASPSSLLLSFYRLLLLLFCCLPPPPPWIYFFNFIKIMEMNEILIRCCALHLPPLPPSLPPLLPAACDIFWTNEFIENCSRRAPTSPLLPPVPGSSLSTNFLHATLRLWQVE